MRTAWLKAKWVRQTALVAASAVAMLTMTNTAHATNITRLLDASLTTGSLAGVSFPASFSYDDSGLTGHGQEFIPLQSFDFTLLGTQFTRADITQGGQAIFQDGTLENVTAALVVSAVVWKIEMAYPSGRLATLAARPRQTVGPRRIRHGEA
jgi:hypothetical protein